MINVINKECCRDCTKCNLINEVPGFDFMDVFESDISENN